MSIFGKIKSAIFGGEAKAAEPAAAPAAIPMENKPAARAAITEVDVAARLDNVPGSDKLNWRTSIVDLMKLVQIDASYENRKELAAELGITGYGGSAEDNIALHKRVMSEIAANGGIVPADLKD
ncbi:DUF3597 domain-containing protein [Parasphingorhabdus halotolerans]|uniref:DUF3597 domain-containing protein n=1 Tax=Parasphingorhabdus halotolerans TaxID=2725558 RepID=A0A6H2DJU1_9SPHN|nr:DUF3597 domain-containing protein [Parasphingorhabdus halotolerans]QJB67926.1 DUF3597 domain-containing protein [Parasphingorhabdus halotolerans]